MPTIEIDDDIWKELQSRAAPLIDTPSTVLRRILDLPGGEGKHAGRLLIQRKIRTRAHGRTRQEVYRKPILRSISQAGGSHPAAKVLEEIEIELGDRLNPVDKEILKSGRDIRWRNAAQWERAAMVKEGLLKSDSPRRVWELTEKGKKVYLKSLLA